MLGHTLPANVVLDCPNGKYTIRGRVDSRLCRRLQADQAAVMGQRAIREGDEIVEYRPIVCESFAGLVAEARKRGFAHVEGGGKYGRFEPIE